MIRRDDQNVVENRHAVHVLKVSITDSPTSVLASMHLQQSIRGLICRLFFPSEEPSHANF
jgi:hypothetical protein